MLEVGLDGVHRDIEPFGYLGVGKAGRQEGQHDVLPRRQLVGESLRWWNAAAREGPAQHRSHKAVRRVAVERSQQSLHRMTGRPEQPHVTFPLSRGHNRCDDRQRVVALEVIEDRGPQLPIH